jgi:hypothetical protein
MGMDVIGRAPMGAEGEYFRASIHSWPPIAEITLRFGPAEVTGRCHAWFTNDRDGLDAALHDGTIEAFVSQMAENGDDGPVATFLKVWSPTGVILSEADDGTLVRRPVTKSDPIFARLAEFGFTPDPAASAHEALVNKLEAWITFLRLSGGFAIW